MTKDEALKLALEALEDACGNRCNSEYNPCFQREAITAIKQALAQPEPWEKFCDSNCVWTDHHPDCKLAQRTWVGLRWSDVPDQWCGDAAFMEGGKWAEKTLKEKNT